MVISILAVISGADGPTAIGVWAKCNEEWLKNRLSLPNGIPSHDTIGRVLMSLKPAAFQKCFEEWVQSLLSAKGSSDQETVAIDGKAVRRSHDARKNLGPLFLVSAWAVRRGVSLGQLATAEKSNELTAIPESLDNIDIRGATVTIDAAGCQTKIASKIVDGKGDYVLSLKGNQGTLHESVEQYVIDQMENEFADVTCGQFMEQSNGHGRTDELSYYQLPVPKDLPGLSKWKGLKTIGVAIRQSVSSKKDTTEARYFISSLKLDVKRFAAAVRGHWAIENTLHWFWDVSFRVDESRVRDRVLTNNLAWLKRFAISLLKQFDDKESIAMEAP